MIPVPHIQTYTVAVQLLMGFTFWKGGGGGIRGSVVLAKNFMFVIHENAAV